MQILDAISGGFVSALRPTEHSLIYILKKKRSYTTCLMSWISTTRVDSPDHPLLLLAVTMNRAAGSITALCTSTKKKIRSENMRWEMT